MQMRLNRLQGAEETLHECLSLPLADGAKGDCLYSLADISVLHDDLDGGASLAAQILDIQDISPELYGKTAFLLADIYEQQQKYAEALQLYLSIREAYPNPLAVDARIDYLKKKTRK
jgi:tetratricopeptide (TPR) repeat protein